MAGDELKSGTISAFTCPACGGSVRITARGITVTVFCSHCGAEIDANNDKMKLVRRAHSGEAPFTKPLLEPGTRGTLDNTQWEVIGFLQRSDKTGHYKWQEYLLFNPAQGFRWLIENRGHWILFRKLAPQAEWPDSDQNFPDMLYLGNQKFDIFERGEAVVREVLGEFYWRVKRKDASRIEDYIAPPQMLSHEIIKSGNNCENLWSLGEYLEPHIVRDAFALKAPLPPRYGPGPSQPNKHRRTAIFATFVAVLLSIVMLVMQKAIETADPQTLAFRATFSSTDVGKTFVGKPFAVTHDNTVLRIDINSGLKNQWAELDIELINDGTGETRHVNQGVELWSGYEDGYYWHEGNTHAEAIVSPVAKGMWHINADYNTSAPGYPPNAINTRMEVFQGAHNWTNLWLALLALWTPVAFIGAAALLFDMNRWSLSDHSPYQQFAESFE